MGLSSLFKLAAFSVFLGIAIGGFFYIKGLGKAECESKQKTAIIEGEKNRDKIEHENKSLERNIIIERLNSNGWLRNS